MVRRCLHRPEIGGQTRVINREGIRSRETCGEVSGNLMCVNIDEMSKRLETFTVTSLIRATVYFTRGRKVNVRILCVNGQYEALSLTSPLHQHVCQVCVPVCHGEAATERWSREEKGRSPG
ncbi:hypothetical protein PV326_009655 [Microctonus aethiopoides]|nr:hypothetical protein PV326_009655 [Microctonus aethiopoides]